MRKVQKKEKAENDDQVYFESNIGYCQHAFYKIKKEKRNERKKKVTRISAVKVRIVLHIHITYISGM
jgi:hypothetical protein